ncbi:MAG: alpha-1,2-fucosyltransferase [Pontiella sp.]
MIRVFLQGGLGNQMFQYAAGRALADKHKTALCLDTSWYHYPVKRKFELDKFRIHAQTEKSFLSFLAYNIWNRPGFGEKHSCIFREKAGGQVDALFDLHDNVEIIGYFMSERFFPTVADAIRAELGFEHRNVSRETESILSDVGSGNSVAMHVRRGDFLELKNYQVCTEAYYFRGLDYVRARVDNPRFYLFSDDPTWCRTVFSDDDCCVVEVTQSRDDSLNDMHLMSSCQHMIMSNSSYSWWAAWLGQTPDQIVVAPDRWLNSDPMNYIFCSDWIKLSAS